jgi:hypothetical protein
MDAIRKIREKWRLHRERIKRLNTSRYLGGTLGNFKTDLDVDAHISRRDYPGKR